MMSGKTEKSLLLGGPQVVLMPVTGTQAVKLMQYGCLSVDMPRQPDDDDNGKYMPLTHRQIAQYAHDPWWLNLRRGLMISFWTSMALMVLAAVLIAIVEHEHVCVAGKSVIVTTTPGAPTTVATIALMPNATLALATTAATILAEIPLAGAYLIDDAVVAVVSEESDAADAHSSIVKWLQHRI